METKTAVTLPAVRKALKAAGLTPAKRSVSTNVSKTHGMGGSYSTVTTQGFALNHETEYRRKHHVRTGNIVVTILLSSWHADEAQADHDLEAAIQAIHEAGFVVTTGYAPHTLIVKPGIERTEV